MIYRPQYTTRANPIKQKLLAYRATPHVLPRIEHTMIGNPTYDPYTTTHISLDIDTSLIREYP